MVIHHACYVVACPQESKTAEDSLHVVEGMQFDRGYISPYFVTDPERMVSRSPDQQASTALCGDVSENGARSALALAVHTGAAAAAARHVHAIAGTAACWASQVECILQLTNCLRPPPAALPTISALPVAEYENCKLLLVDKKISTARDMIGILEGAIRGGYPLLIMAEDIEQVGADG